MMFALPYCHPSRNLSTVSIFGRLSAVNPGLCAEKAGLGSPANPANASTTKPAISRLRAVHFMASLRLPIGRPSRSACALAQQPGPSSQADVPRNAQGRPAPQATTVSLIKDSVRCKPVARISTPLPDSTRRRLQAHGQPNRTGQLHGYGRSSRVARSDFGRSLRSGWLRSTPPATPPTQSSRTSASPTR